MPNGLSFRVIKGCKHNLLLDRIEWAYSSSANLSGFEYDELYARDTAEIIVSFPLKSKGEASKIYYLGICRMKSIR